MGKIIAVANQKGGVGKTTTAVNVTGALKLLNKKVLLCDSDPQGNATGAMGIDKSRVKAGTYDIMIGRTAAKDAVRHGGSLPACWIISCGISTWGFGSPPC